MKDIISRLFAFIASLWRTGKKFIDEHLKDAVDFTNILKKIADSPTTDLITTLIPGTWDDKAIAWLRAALPLAAEATGILVTCSPEEGPIEYIECLAAEIAKGNPKQRPGLLRDFAAQLALAKAKVSGFEHELSLKNVNLALELDYNHRFSE